jgi:hypothetical protein
MQQLTRFLQIHDVGTVGEPFMGWDQQLRRLAALPLRNP